MKDLSRTAKREGRIGAMDLLILSALVLKAAIVLALYTPPQPMSVGSKFDNFSSHIAGFFSRCWKKIRRVK